MINKFNNKSLKKILIYYLYGSLTINSFFYQKDNHNNVTNIIEFFDDIFNTNYTNCKYELPVLGTFIPQGLCIVNDVVYITAYDGKKEKNSVIFEITEDNSYRTIVLDTTAHVGGIAYDEINNLFWVCDTNGTISSYDYEDVIKNDYAISKSKKINVNDNDLINHKGNASAAFISIFNNKIYIGNFSTDDNGILKCYELTNDGQINFETLKIYKIPNNVQGVTFYEYKNDTYILFSESYGRFKNSILEICLFDGNVTNYRNTYSLKYETPRMMEEIIIDDDNNLLMLFESNAYKYKNGLDDMDELQSIDIKRLIRNF